MKRPGPMGSADARPRIHIWPTRVGAYWALSPNGHRTSELSAGEALEAALDAIDHRSAVIIYEAQS
jgi:hypothetical protein